MKRVMIIAGEASGDLHAARLVQDITARTAEVRFFGIGGANMQKAGVEILVDSAELAVVGIWEVLAHRKTIFAALNQMREILRTAPPDLLILVDYPDFNLRLAETAKKHGTKVLYYISPQVWAWRQGRVKKIRHLVDMMAVVFPFEEKFYKKHKVPVCYVGHPLTDEVHSRKNQYELLTEFGLDPASKTVGLFPGSRQSEIKRLFPIILESASRLQQHYSDIQFLLPIASTLSEEILLPFLNQYKSLRVKMIAERGHDVMKACDAIITVSGTVTLEIAIIGTPMVIINKLSWLTYSIVKHMVKIPYIGLCNLVANEKLVPELIQHDAKPELISAEIQKMLDDKAYNSKIREKLSQVNAILKNTPSNYKIDEIAMKMLDSGK